MTVPSSPRRAAIVPAKLASKRFVKNKIPIEILSDPALKAAAAALLPFNYDFKIHKIVYYVVSSTAHRVTLQLLDGLLMYTLPLTCILRSSSASTEDVLILADPTYGACCLDDFTASAL